ncbi:MAG: hypothetical protein ACOC98_08910, partial [Thermodesulfobacteriota bacterium]
FGETSAGRSGGDLGEGRRIQRFACSTGTRGEIFSFLAFPVFSDVFQPYNAYFSCRVAMRPAEGSDFA